MQLSKLALRRKIQDDHRKSSEMASARSTTSTPKQGTKSRDLLSSGSGASFFGAQAYVSNTPRAADEPSSPARRPAPKPRAKAKAAPAATGSYSADSNRKVSARMTGNGVDLQQVRVQHSCLARSRSTAPTTPWPVDANRAAGWRARRATPKVHFSADFTMIA